MSIELLSCRLHLPLIVLTGGGMLIALICSGFRLLRNKQAKSLWNKPCDEDFELVGEVSRLFLYPVKGCAGVEVSSIKVTSHGLQSEHGILDRSFFVMKDQRVLNSIRCRAISYIQIRIVLIDLNPAIELSYPIEKRFGTVLVPLMQQLPRNAKIIEAKFQKNNFKGVDCGDNAANWLGQVLGLTEVRLAQHLPSLCYRSANSVGKRSIEYEQEFKILYQNYTDLHMISEESLQALNLRLANDGSPEGVEQVDGLNFRPNVFVKNTLEAWHEDRWAHIRIGCDCELEQVENCFRCMNTTISKLQTENTETIKQRVKVVATKEPLNTLRKFRRAKNEDEDKRVQHSPFFGCLMGTRRPGLIKVGDQVKAVIVEEV